MQFDFLSHETDRLTPEESDALGEFLITYGRTPDEIAKLYRLARGIVESRAGRLGGEMCN
jgi:hypothetical protein